MFSSLVHLSIFGKFSARSFKYVLFVFSMKYRCKCLIGPTKDSHIYCSTGHRIFSHQHCEGVATAVRMIPPIAQIRENSPRPMMHQSAPVNVPDWSKFLGAEKKNKWADCRGENGLIFFCISCRKCKAHLNFTFRIQIPHGFQNRVILLQNKTKYGLVGTKGLGRNIHVSYSLLITKSTSDENVPPCFCTCGILTF